jgi:hypothetical protein
VVAEIRVWSLFIINLGIIMMKTLLLLLLVSLSTSAFGQSGGRFTITRGVIAGGGTNYSSSARFKLAGTIAQPLAAVPASARFAVRGGFWIWPAPIIFAPAMAGDNFVFSLQTEPGKTYTVQYIDALGPLNWQQLTNVAGDGSVKTLTNSAPGVDQRFYRLIEQ